MDRPLALSVARFAELVLALLWLAHPASAGVLFVDQDASGTADGSSWANAFVFLQPAISAAASGDEIWVAEGIYYPDQGPGQTNNDESSTFNMIPGVGMYGGFSGSESLRSQRNPATHPTVLSGEIQRENGLFGFHPACADHVVSATQAGAPATLDGFTVFAGNADKTVGAGGSGGGLRVADGASLTVSQCIFEVNESRIAGAAIYVENSSPIFDRCTLTSNGTFGVGGGVHAVNSFPEFNHCHFVGNSSTSAGAANITNSSATFVNCLFEGNSALDAGGAVRLGSDVVSAVSFINCAFEGNAANKGGALNVKGVQPILVNCAFAGNSANQGGGAIHNNSASYPLTNCLFWNNLDQAAPGTPTGSITNISSTPTYSHCMVQHFSKATLDGTGSSPDNNFDSTDPRFYNDGGIITGVTFQADVHLLFVSPFINRGDSLANATVEDLDANARKIGTIDLGPFEVTPVFVDLSATGNGFGDSWENAKTSMAEALFLCEPNREVWVAEGTHYPDTGFFATPNAPESSFVLKSGVAVYGGFAGTEFLLSERVVSAHPTILSGDIDQNDTGTPAGTNAYHVLVANSVAQPALLDGFIVRGGNAVGGSGNNTGGGLLVNDDATLTILNCIFRQNLALTGGAVHCLSSFVTFRECTLESNSAGGGGAVYATASECEFINSKLFGNETTAASGALGGAVYVVGGTLQATNTAFAGNYANTFGGAIFITSAASELVNCVFEGNQSVSSGGAIRYATVTSAVLKNCLIWNNRAGTFTTTANASIAASSTVPIFSNCLVANFSKASLDGSGASPNNNLTPSDPFFVLPLDPATAPELGSDLRLLSGSPALDAGNNSDNLTATDLAGSPRIQGIAIDLGAFEGSFDTFAHRHPLLDPEADDNGNGRNNFGDYAAGADPAAPDDPATHPVFSMQGGQFTLESTARANTLDVLISYERSENLVDYFPLVEGVDYLPVSETSDNVFRLRSLFQLLIGSSDTAGFFRQVFDQVP